METKYRVQSLERGLSILGVMQRARSPLRNQDLVQRTGLPKATVSRLLYTLMTLGYVRRIDLGAYVLSNVSARGGQALLGALQLQRHNILFSKAPGTVFLEAVWEQRSIAIYSWSQTGAGVVTNGAALEHGPSARLGCRPGGNLWEPMSSTWWAWAHTEVAGVGCFVITQQHVREALPDVAEIARVHDMLKQAGSAMSCSTEH